MSKSTKTPEEPNEALAPEEQPAPRMQVRALIRLVYGSLVREKGEQFGLAESSQFDPRTMVKCQIHRPDETLVEADTRRESEINAGEAELRRQLKSDALAVQGGPVGAGVFSAHQVVPPGTIKA